MPGTSGTITVRGSPERTLEAEVMSVEIAEATLASAELEHIKRFVDPTATTLPVKPRLGPAFQPTKETKTFQVHPEDPAKMVIIMGDLPKEQEAALLQFLLSNSDIYAWRPAYMPGVPAKIVDAFIFYKGWGSCMLGVPAYMSIFF